MTEPSIKEPQITKRGKKPSSLPSHRVRQIGSIDIKLAQSLRLKMMIYLFIRQQVEDYPQWKEGFDTHLSARQAGGATRDALVLRNVDAPLEIIVVLGWRDLKQAKLFSQSVSLQVALKTMGVVGVPEVRFLEAVIVFNKEFPASAP